MGTSAPIPELAAEEKVHPSLYFLHCMPTVQRIGAGTWYPLWPPVWLLQEEMDSNLHGMRKIHPAVKLQKLFVLAAAGFRNPSETHWRTRMWDLF